MHFHLFCAPTRRIAVRLAVYSVALLSSLALSCVGFAQDNSYGAIVGQQAYQMYAENSIESVNVANGNLNIQIPLLSYKQRGSLPPVTLSIVYNADNWTLTQPGTPGGFGQPVQQQFFDFIGGGAVFTVSPFLTTTQLSKSYPDDGGTYTISQTGVVDTSGAVHLMAHTTQTAAFGKLKRSVDASGYLLDTEYDAAGNVHTTLLGPDGVGYRDGAFSDPNGNTITSAPTSNPTGATQGTNGFIASYTDSLGRVLPMPSNYQALQPQPGCQTLQYPGPPSSPQIPLTLCYTNYAVSSPFTGIPASASPGSHLVAISSVTLPNGTQWKFSYNGYGDLTSLSYPTGATVTYNWENGGTCSAYGRVLQSRTINTGQRSDTWTYSYNYDPSAQPEWTTTEQDQIGNKIIHGAQSSCSAETYTQYVDAAIGVVSTTNYTYTQSSPQSSIGTEVGYNKILNQVRRKATTTLANGLVKQTCFIYDNDTDTTCSGDQQQPGATNLMFYDDTLDQAPPPQPEPPNYQPPAPTPYPLVLGKLLYQYESDWGQGSPGPWLRKTVTHYKWQDDAGYLAANLIDLPASVCVPLPGASACTQSTGDTASYTSYGYDENNGSPQGVFGNQTSVAAWTGSGPSLATSTVFSANGMPTSVTDPAKRTTTMAYDASGLYLNSVTAPATNGVSHVTGFSYDDPSGVLTSSTDENGGVTSYVYDSMERAKSITTPVGTTTYNYVDPSSSNPLPYFTTAQSIDGARNLTRQVNLDGLGRTTSNLLTSDPDGQTSTETTYDALGRVWTVTNPHRSGSSPTDGTTTYTYDVLGRTTAVTLPDGNTQGRQYPGNTIQITDEVGSQWQQTTDGLGRLTQVLEPDAVTGKPAYETDYAYDVLGNLLRADQWGGPHGNTGDRVRTFTYDGLSRLLTASLPESGTTTYSYLAYGSNNNALCSGSASNLCSKTDARGAIATYSYDELGRVTSTRYPNGGGTVSDSTFAYDLPKSGWTFPNQTFPNGQAVTQQNLIGRLSWEQNANATVVYGYDGGGRTALKSVCTPVNCGAGDHYDMHLAYDGLGNPTFTDLGRDALLNNSNPGAGYYYGGLTLAYTTAGRLQSGTADTTDATHPGSIVAMSQYNPLGNAGLTTFGNIFNVQNTYSPRGWITERDSSVPVANLTRTDHLDYTPSGNTNDLVDSMLGTTNYTFDKLNRLTSFSNPYAASIQYGYDAWANMTAHTITNGAGYNYSAQVDANNHIVGMGYDGSGAGLLTSDSLNNYSYDAAGKLTQVNGEAVYLYDPEGNRVAKQLNGAIQVQYLYAPDGTLTTTLGPDSKLVRATLYGGGVHLADYTGAPGTAAGHTEFQLVDQVGSLFVKIDQAGNVLATCSATPFGESFSCAPQVDYTETHFADKLQDQESGLEDFSARFYDPPLARFTVPDFSDGSDPVPYADLSNPQSLNLYSYAANNPTSNQDPDGHKPCGGDDADSQQEGAPNPCDPKVSAPPESITVHATIDDSLSLYQVALSNVQQGLQMVSSYINAPRDPGCTLGSAGTGAAYGGLAGTGLGGIAGGAGGSLFAPGVGTFGGALAGAGEGGAVGAQVGTAVGTAFGFISCYQGGGGGGTSAGSANQKVKRGQAPKSVRRVDVARSPFEQDNVHFEDGTALNRDGSWKHGSRQLTNIEKEWLASIGWGLPK